MDIIVYTRTVCPYCSRLKQFIKMNGGNVIERNVETDATARAQWETFGVMGVPVTILGDKAYVGFNGEVQQRILDFLDGADAE